ncbi:MAG: magnesium/cobalt transporter CorA [Xanthomonadales bacterium]|nr:magnesium/cobalt transporter CorA [Xanthomonadales bacterium]
MGRLVPRITKKAGSAPGTIVHTGEQKVEQSRLSFLDYNADGLREKNMADISECLPLKDMPTVSWINLDGLHDIATLESLGKRFGLHALVLEDIASVSQRAKIEEFDDHIYVVMHMLFFDETKDRVFSEQLSLVVGENFVLSFQERIGDVFEPVRERLRAGKGRIRSRGPDYLAYALIDAVVDNYYAVLEKIGDRVETLDATIMEKPTEDTLHQIHVLKREMLVVRRSVWPVREVVSSLYRSDHALVSEETKVFLRDVYDHAVQVLDTVETLRDLTAGLTDLYLSAVGHRQNEVMKVLTIMASIFIPLTFLAGIYGMNFENMPELSIAWAYPALLGFMAVMAGLMAWYFRRRGWW